jgi:hypothetical protein
VGGVRERRAHVQPVLGIAFATAAASHQAKWLRDLPAGTREPMRIDKKKKAFGKTHVSWMHQT